MSKFSHSQGPPTLKPSDLYTAERPLYMLGVSKRIRSHILVPNWHRVRATTKTTSLGRVRLEVSKYAAVMQATRSTPNGTQLIQYPSSHETIRLQNSRPGVRLPHRKVLYQGKSWIAGEKVSQIDPQGSAPESSTTGEVRKPAYP